MQRTQPDGVRSGPGDTDRTLHSLRRFVRLAATGNPSILTLPSWADRGRRQTRIMVFTEMERAYLATQPLGRLASHGPDGAPQVHPVAYRVNPEAGTIDVGGPELAASQKFRNVRADPRIAFVVDDLATPEETLGPGGQLGRGIELRGRAEIRADADPLMEGFSDELIRIHPERIVAWNLDGPGRNARDVGERRGEGRDPDRQEIAAVIDTYRRGFATMDVEILEGMWDPSQDQLVYVAQERSRPIVGWPGIEAYYEQLPDGDPSDSSASMDVREVATTVLGDAAHVFCTFHYEGAVAGQDEPFVADGRVTFILSRRTGSWKVVHYHESVPGPIDPG